MAIIRLNFAKIYFYKVPINNNRKIDTTIYKSIYKQVVDDI
jgi:hypothetical protein